MTVNVQIPFNNYLGTGSLKTFAFTFGLVELVDMTVFVDSVLQIRNTDYDVIPQTGVSGGTGRLFLNGGDIEFTNAPASNAIVLIQRKTTISQQLDYTASAFPSETHEEQLDKLVFILQELLVGVIGGDITFDLSVQQNEETVLIINSGGTDALLPSWKNATLAGVFYGEITDDPPAKDSVTGKPDGYTWYKIG